MENKENIIHDLVYMQYLPVFLLKSAFKKPFMVKGSLIVQMAASPKVRRVFYKNITRIK